MLFTRVCFADMYYVMVEVDPDGKKHGHEDGDAVVSLPVTAQYEPTRGELQSYRIFKVDLTDAERASLHEEHRKIVAQAKEFIIEKIDLTAFTKAMGEGVFSNYVETSKVENPSDSNQWIINCTFDQSLEYKASKRTINYAAFSATKQKEEIAKNDFLAEITVKPDFISP